VPGVNTGMISEAASYFRSLLAVEEFSALFEILLVICSAYFKPIE
jgi:hypothetical protein